MKKKTVRLWKWAIEKENNCQDCVGKKDMPLCDKIRANACGVDFIFKTEKPEPEFVDVEVDE